MDPQQRLEQAYLEIPIITRSIATASVFITLGCVSFFPFSNQLLPLGKAISIPQSISTVLQSISRLEKVPVLALVDQLSLLWAIRRGLSFSSLFPSSVL